MRRNYAGFTPTATAQLQVDAVTTFHVCRPSIVPGWHAMEREPPYLYLSYFRLLSFLLVRSAGAYK